MKKILLLTALALTLTACPQSRTPATIPPSTTTVYQTRDYTFDVAETSTLVQVKPKHLGTTFCFTDVRFHVCNNLSTGSRTMPTGSAYGASFSAVEDGVTVDAK